MFHRHNWIEKERFFAEPSDMTRLRSCSEYLAQQLIQGVTTISYECIKCGKTRTKEILGKSMKEPNPNANHTPENR